MASNAFNLSERLKLCGVTYGQIVQAGNDMFDLVQPFAVSLWPNMSDAVVDNNLAVLYHLHKYHIACGLCKGVEDCPSFDATRTRGRLGPDGVISIWQEPCPKGRTVPKGETVVQVEQRSQRSWRRKDL